MMRLHFKWLYGAITLLSLLAPAQAARIPTELVLAEDISACDSYARKALSQYQVALAAHCTISGLRWNDDWERQAAWCGTVRPAITQQETKARAETLLACFKTQIPLQDKDLTATPRQLYQALEKALAQDNLRRAQQLIAAGAHTGFKDYEWTNTDYNLLSMAIMAGADKLTRFLITLNIDPNVSKNGGIAPLYELVQRKPLNYDLLEFLLKHGADPNYGGEIGVNGQPLFKTTEDVKATQLLLQYGADPAFVCGKYDYSYQPSAAVLAEVRRAAAKRGQTCDW